MDERRWMGVAAVLGIAAIGLGVWAFTTKSDLNDANDKVAELQKSSSSQAAQNANLAQQSGAEARKNTELSGFDKRESARYRRAHHGLISADRQNADLKRQATKDSDALDKAHKELGSANSKNEKQAAKLKVADATSAAAISCAQATVDSLEEFDSSNSAGRPAERVLRRLDGLIDPCRTVLHDDKSG